MMNIHEPLLRLWIFRGQKKDKIAFNSRYKRQNSRWIRGQNHYSSTNTSNTAFRRESKILFSLSV